MKVGELFAEMRMDFKPFDRDERLAKARVTTLGGTLSGILKNAFSFTLGMGLFQGVKSLGGLAKDFVLTAGKTETLDVALQAVARSTGTSVRALLQERNALMDLGIAEQEASQILTRFMQAQIDTADAAKLARVAQDSAVVAGENSSQAAAKMTEAIAKQRPELLSAYGMTRNLNDIFGDYAKTIGKAASQLSETERKQAMLSYILKEGEKVAGAYERSMGSAFKKLGSLTRYVDTFKTAVARPLALPAFGVVIDAVTDAFKRGIAWAETNKAALQAWGQAVSQAVQKALGWVRAFTGFIAANWGTIISLTRATVAAFISFQIATRAVNGLRLVTAALAGESLITSGILGFVSKVIGTYKLQIHLASLAGIAHVGVIQAVKTALWSLYASIPGVGWALLAITAILTGGIVAWSKYQSSLLKASQAKYAEQIKKSQEQMAESTKKATKSTEGQAEALGELGKASQKNLQSFDEVHTLMDDMGDVPGLDIAALDDVSMPSLEMPDDMFASFEAELPPFGERIKEFFGWLWDGIKTGAQTAWDATTGFLKNAWQGVVDFARPIWEPLAPFFTALWEGIKVVTTAVWDFIGPYLSGAWTWIADTAKAVWESIGPFFSGLWNGIKIVTETVWGLIKYVLATVWFSIVEMAEAAWSVLGPFFGWLWDGIKTITLVTWEILKAILVPLWEGIVEIGKAIWSVLEPFFSALWSAVKWIFETVWKPLAAWLSGVWEGIKTAAQTVWGLIQKVIVDPIAAARATVETIAGKIRDAVTAAQDKTLAAVKAVKDTLYKYIVEPFVKAKETVERIVDAAKDWGKNLMSNITDGIKSKVNSVKTAVSNAASAVKNFLGFSSPTREGPGRDADRWAPNLMKMYAQGISSNAGLIQSAANEAAKGLAAMNAFNVAPAFAGAGSAFSSPSMSAAGLAQGSASGDMTFIVKIGEDTFIEKVISGINRKSRASGETLITV